MYYAILSFHSYREIWYEGWLLGRDWWGDIIKSMEKAVKLINSSYNYNKKYNITLINNQSYIN